MNLKEEQHIIDRAWEIRGSTSASAEQMNFDVNSIPSAWKGHHQFADWLVRTTKPDLTVELGVDYGFSSIVFAIPDIGRVIGIDAFKGDDHAGHRDVYDECLRNVHRARVRNLEIWRNTFDDAKYQFPCLCIDILHIDGRHGYEDVKHDFESWFPLVRSGGVILMHDTRSFPNDVGRFFKELPYSKFEFTHSHGLGVVTVP